MSSLLNVEGKEYTAATIAGKRFGYTKDYLLLLIKKGKIEGRKIGNKWYVHIPSAETFFKVHEEKKKERRKQVSQKRKTELKHHVRARVNGHHRTAVIETLVIVIIGLSLGVTGYMGTNAQEASIAGNAANFFERIALSFHAFISGEEVVVAPANIAVEPANNDTVIANTAKENQAIDSLIVAPEHAFTAESIDSIRDSFSDPVEVSIDPENPDTGIVVPMFRSGEGDAYRFLMVPVKMETERTETP